MAFTLDQYNKLCENIAQGVEEVEYADKKVKYMPLSDMIRLEAYLASKLGINEGSRKIVSTFKTGLNNGVGGDDRWAEGYGWDHQ